MRVFTYGELWEARQALCAARGFTIWEAEAKVVAGEIHWRTDLSLALAAYRVLLEEPPLKTPPGCW